LDENDVIRIEDPMRSPIEPRLIGSMSGGDSAGSEQEEPVPSPDSGSPRGPSGPGLKPTVDVQEPRYPTSSRTSSGNVDVTIEVNWKSFITNVIARDAVDKWQKNSAHGLATYMWRHWYQFAMEEDGCSGPLCAQDHTVFRPGSELDVARMKEARTQAATTQAPPKLVTVGRSKPNYLELLARKEPFLR
jgi:hypothetical protein